MSAKRRSVMMPTPDTRPLTSQEKAYLSASALESAFQLVEKSIVQGGSINWAKYATHGDIKLYTASGQYGTTMFCGVFEVGGLLDDAIAFLRHDGECTAAPHSTHDIEPPLQDLESNPLYSLHASTPDQAPIDIMWRSYQCPLRDLVVRDMCLLEFGRVFPAGSRHGYVQVAKSIDIASCAPPDPATTGVVRAVNHGSGMVVMECDRRGVLAVVCVSHIDLQVEFHQNSIARKVMLATCVAELRRLERHLKHVRMLHNQRHPGLVVEIVPKAIRRYCHVCAAKFPALCRVSKHHCSHCGEVVCSTCHTIQFVKGRSVAPTKFNLCVLCVSTLPPNTVTVAAGSPNGKDLPTTPPTKDTLDMPTSTRKTRIRSASKWWRRSSSTGGSLTPHDVLSTVATTPDSYQHTMTGTLSKSVAIKNNENSPTDQGGSQETSPSKSNVKLPMVWNLPPSTATMILMATCR
ncbi:hypothetical protein H310_10199 [Aphanomyces invadans]|uniref:FYVE-type domain-containing protein n=1 Tax=Aphanomyces invadans TaxID=157072 RepID=A0A024TT25_9STRA|nr:hypothetical protein H310_10199 [Aphanomyces invadans]ETV96447.1 hypothetical protein H310_10199 [Aphanomyces invadans]|eukprot:XP_008874710.1 hypothetical protein H310_10199 [Aphanomyces invadans]